TTLFRSQFQNSEVPAMITGPTRGLGGPGSRKGLEAGGWRLEAGGWRLEAGGWRLEAGGWTRWGLTPTSVKLCRPAFSAFIGFKDSASTCGPPRHAAG